MTRRYSHLGPVAMPHGRQLSRALRKTLYAAHDDGASWEILAECCEVSRSTLTRALAGGNVHADTTARIQRFADIWEFEAYAQRMAYERKRVDERRAA